MALQQVSDLGDDGRGHNDRPIGEMEPCEQLYTTMMVGITGNCGRDEWPCVANDHAYRPKPSRSSSSLRAPTGVPSPSTLANQAGGHGLFRTGRRCLRTSASACGTCSSGSSCTSRINSSRSALMRIILRPWPTGTADLLRTTVCRGGQTSPAPGADLRLSQSLLVLLRAPMCRRCIGFVPPPVMDRRPANHVHLPLSEGRACRSTSARRRSPGTRQDRLRQRMDAFF